MFEVFSKVGAANILNVRHRIDRLKVCQIHVKMYVSLTNDVAPNSNILSNFAPQRFLDLHSHSGMSIRCLIRR